MIGIDIGGANLKVADESGIHSYYCPLYEGAPLARLLMQHRSGASDPAAVVMSGELADCFTDKTEGIWFIVDTVRGVFPGAIFYGTDAAFHNGPVPELAAANWLAAADFLQDRYPDAILVDCGSTTTDIVPLTHFEDLKGLTDLMRLKRGYLLYTGMLRTTLPAVLQTVTIGGTEVPVSAEYFAIAADAHLVLGTIDAGMYSCDTPDKKEKTVTASLRRLARVVCSDLAEIGNGNALSIAGQFRTAQLASIRRKVRAVMDSSGASRIITAGIGSAYLANELGGTDLSRDLGPEAEALPAVAVREVALRKIRPATKQQPGHGTR